MVMNTFVSWRPIPLRVMGQAQQLPLVPLVPPDMAVAPIDSAAAQFVTAGVSCVASGLLGYAFGTKRSRWSTFFWAISAVSAFKAFFCNPTVTR